MPLIARPFRRASDPRSAGLSPPLRSPLPATPRPLPPALVRPSSVLPGTASGLARASPGTRSGRGFWAPSRTLLRHSLRPRHALRQNRVPLPCPVFLFRFSLLPLPSPDSPLRCCAQHAHRDRAVRSHRNPAPTPRRTTEKPIQARNRPFSKKRNEANFPDKVVRCCALALLPRPVSSPLHKCYPTPIAAPPKHVPRRRPHPAPSTIRRPAP